MWLLDHNVPVQLRGLLTDFGVEVETVVARGWQALRNGDLVGTANREGFAVILTRDTGFAEAARPALDQLPGFAVVVIRLPQRAWRLYEVEFRRAWSVKKIEPVPGKVVEWP
jgi:predicted nuclease of predicted toxin-antitoxin system